jgi:uncharacterized DUF497 family protein
MALCEGRIAQTAQFLKRDVSVYTITQMKITFDPAKRLENLANRQLDFMDAKIVLSGQVLTTEDTRKDYGEQRFQTVGFLAGRMVMVVWTPRDKTTHVISMRKCNVEEQTRYTKRFEES